MTHLGAALIRGMVKLPTSEVEKKKRPVYGRLIETAVSCRATGQSVDECEFNLDRY